MNEIINKILEKMPNVCKAQRKFVLNVMITILSARGKINFRNVSRYTHYCEKTVSRQFHKPFDFAEFNRMLTSEVFNENSCLVAVFDPSFIPKAGKKTYGKDYFWSSTASRAEKGLEIGVFGVVDIDANTSYAISAMQTPPLAEIQKDSTAENRIDFYLGHINRDAKHLPLSVRHLTVDGYFFKQKFVDGILNGCGLEVIGKARHDAHFCYPYAGQQKARGRRRKYEGKVDIDDLSKFNFVGIVDDEIALYSAILYSVALKRLVGVAVIIIEERKKPVILFSTDLNLEPENIYRYYKARYQIEFVFRDAKQFTGLCDCQARTKEQLHWHFNVSLATLNFAKVRDRLEKKTCSPTVFSMLSWKARYFNENFINLIFSTFGFDLDLQKSSPHFQGLVNLGTISC